MNLRGRPGRWARRVTAATVAGVGVVNLARAVSAAPRRTGGLSTLGELATLVVGTRYVLVSAGLAALLAAPSLLRGKRAA